MIITATMATWVLLVRMQSPIHPDAHIIWDKNYGAFSTPQECENLAHTAWRSYYQSYGKDVNTWEYVLTTTCQAESHHKKWKWFITCDMNNLCSKRTYEGTQ